MKNRYLVAVLLACALLLTNKTQSQIKSTGALGFLGVNEALIENETDTFKMSIIGGQLIGSIWNTVENSKVMFGFPYSVNYYQKTFPEDLFVSKGYFGDYIELKWELEFYEDLVGNFRIYRKILGSTTSPVLVAIVGSDIRMWRDEYAESGTMYEYTLFATNVCPVRRKYVNYIEGIGYRYPTGNISGRVTYAGGNAVEGVQIIAETEDEFSSSSLFLDGTSSHISLVPPLDHEHFQFDSEFVFQGWFLPQGGSNSTLFQKGDQYKITHQNGQVNFMAGGQTLTVDFTEKVDTFFNVTAMRGPEKLTLLVFYELDNYHLASIDFASTTPSNNLQVLIGKNSSDSEHFEGYMHEISIWHKSTTHDHLINRIGRRLSGTESGLSAYYRMNEGIGDYIYDASRKGFNFNQKHASLTNCTWETLVPFNRQLAVKGITDVNGNYMVGSIPYATDGSVYRFVPVFEVHEFDPNEKSLFIGPGATSHNNIDFIDIAAFRVTGNIKYKDTYFPVEDVMFYIDEKLVVKPSGMPVTSDALGNYEIYVPIGYHNLSIAKNGHTFEVDRFPLEGDWNFQEPITGLNFSDITKVKVIGRVVGGPREAEKLKGLGHSINNLGNALVTMTTQRNLDLTDNDDGIDVSFENEVYEDGEIVSRGQTGYEISGLNPRHLNITPDIETGEFVAYLLPERYVITGITAGDYVFDESFHTILDLKSFLHFNETEIDSVITSTVYDPAGNPIHQYRVDSVNYNTHQNLVYRAMPSIDVASQDGDEVFWEKEFEAGEGVIIPLTNEDGSPRTDYPVFFQRKHYTLKVSVFEKYINVDNGDSEDLVPVSDGLVEIQNMLSVDRSKISIQLNDDGEAFYDFMGGLPNVTQGGIGDYLLPISVVSRTGQNNAIATQWRQGNPFKGYIFGGLPTGNNFVTTGPNEVLMILRDPPGSNSSATFSTGYEKTTSKTYSASHEQSASVSAKFQFGATVKTFAGVGAGIITETEYDHDLTIGFEQTTNWVNEKTTSATFTATQEWSTSNSSDFVGADGDVFIGYSTNIVYGLSENISLLPEGSGYDHTGDVIDGYIIGKEKAFRLNPEFDTGFQYSLYHVENYLIPNMKMLRNSFLLSANPVYQCVICDPEDPEFASDNIDPTLSDTGIADGTSYNVFIPLDWPADSLFVDSIAFFNQQIEEWKLLMYENEYDKIHSELEENLSFDAGTTYTSTSTNSNSTARTKSFKYSISPSLAGEFGFSFNKFGVSFEFETKYTYEETETDETTIQTSTTHSYTLSDDNPGDYFSVDVKKSLYQYGPVFKTRGGQSKCPYEGGTETEYYEPGLELNAATMQREVPQITCTNPIAVNVPADLPAFFNFQFANISETDDDAWMMVSVDDTTNQDGALIEMDGSPIGDGRLIFLPAKQTINKVISLKKVQPDVYDYEEIAIVLSSLCYDINNEIFDELKISASFQPVCTSVDLHQPVDKWLVNTNTDTILNINIRNYNLAHSSFDKLLLQYKSASSSNWVTDMVFYVNESDYDSANQPKFYINNLTTLNHDLDMKSLQDRKYDLKVVSTCVDGTANNSLVASGIKDVKRPRVFGTPQPASGILNPGDNVMVTFDEPIFEGGLLPYNFSVRGVLNGTPIRHQSCLYFNRQGNYASAISGVNLDNKSWTIEFWARRGDLTEGVIFAQDGIELGFDSSNRFYSKTGNQVMVSQSIFTDMETWYHFAVVYDKNAQLFHMYMNDVIERESVPQISPFTGSGRMLLGKDLDGTKLFNGFVHELRIWEKTLGFGTIYSQMLQELSGNEVGLGGYWPMNEAKGDKAQDKARNRHAVLFGAEWRVFPTGHARVFDGNSVVEIDTSSSVIIRDDMNFMLEFYFKAEPQANTVMFSNGRGDNTDPSPPYQHIWVIGFDANGQLYAKNNGTTILVNDQNYTDNQWYHFALVVNRMGNANIFIDSQFKAHNTSSAFGGMVGAKAALGARRFASGPTYDQFFVGMLDELRIWNLARTARQIELDMSSKLQGDEIGLLAYYPFDKYDDLGIALMPTLEDFAGEAPDAIATNGSTTQVNVPNLKDARPVQPVNFDWVVNNDRIIINLNEPPALIEKCILEFTVDRVEDLNENRIASPVTWAAFIKQNTVVWDEVEINIEKEVYAPYSFKTKILNTGGSNQVYSISGMPNWLTCSDPTGSLGPDSFKEVTFVIDPIVNVGEYNLSLFLTSDFGYSERLNVNIDVTKPAPDWNVDPANYQYSMAVVGQLKIEGKFSMNKNDRVAAFVNGQCRGVTSNVYVEAYDKFMVFLSIYSNVEAGENVTFKIWNATEGVIHTNVTPELLFVNNDVVGSLQNPVILESTYSYSFEQSLNLGWTWISFNLANDVLSDVNIAFADIVAQTGDQVKSQTMFATYTAPHGWDGSLVFGGGFTNKDMYMLKLTNYNELNYIGSKLVPESIQIPLNTGWNWIGYTPSSNMYLNDAFAFYPSAQDDIIKSQYLFAMYDKNVGWLGNLTYLVPGLGYMFKTSNEPGGILTYPNSGFKSSVEGTGYEPVKGTPWVLKESDYPHNMSVVATLNLQPGVVLSNNNAVGAFAGTTCRGIARPIKHGNDELYFITIFGQTNENISFKVVDMDTDHVYEVSENIILSIDDVIGTISEPFVLNLKLEPTNINDLNEGTFMFSAYPNPFASTMTIVYNLPTSELISIELFDVLGKKKSTVASGIKQAGLHSFELDGGYLSPGTYVLKFVSATHTEVVSIIKQ